MNNILTFEKTYDNIGEIIITEGIIMKMTKRDMAILVVSALHNLDHIATKKDRLAWITIDKMEKTYSRSFLENNIDKAITVLKSRNIIVSNINK